MQIEIYDRTNGGSNRFTNHTGGNLGDGLPPASSMINIPNEGVHMKQMIYERNAGDSKRFTTRPGGNLADGLPPGRPIYLK